MLNVIDFQTGELPPTKTYGRRAWCFIPANREHPEWDRRLGNLTLKMQPASTGWGRRVEIDTYAIEEEPPIVGLPGRVFLLVNLTDESQEQPYQVIVGPYPQCTCKAAKCKAESDKHLDAMTYLVGEGIIDSVSMTNL